MESKDSPSPLREAGLSYKDDHKQNLSDPIVQNSADKKNFSRVTHKHEEAQKVSQKIAFDIEKLPKICTPYSYLQYTTKYNANKDKYMGILNEIGLNEEMKTQMESMDFRRIFNETESTLKKTYSIKYLGLKGGQIGILSKRKAIEPLSKKRESQHGSVLQITKNSKSMDPRGYTSQEGWPSDPFALLMQNELKNEEYVVNKYMLPKQLHAIKKTAVPERETKLKNSAIKFTNVFEEQNPPAEPDEKAWENELLSSKLSLSAEKRNQEIMNKTKLIVDRKRRQVIRNFGKSYLKDDINNMIEDKTKVPPVISYSNLLKNFESPHFKSSDSLEKLKIIKKSIFL